MGLFVVKKIVDHVERSDKFPLFISNKEFPIIEESYYIIKALENLGYQVDTFVNRGDKTYGITVRSNNE